MLELNGLHPLNALSFFQAMGKANFHKPVVSANSPLKLYDGAFIADVQ